MNASFARLLDVTDSTKIWRKFRGSGHFASNAAVVSIEGRLGELANTFVEQKTREFAVRLETIITVLEEDGYDIPGTIEQK